MMKKITRRSFLSICGAAAAAAALTACGGAASSTAASSAAASGTAASASSTAALSGNVATGGSTSMKNVIAALTEGFAEIEPDVTISYDPTGSGAGITGAADKTLDIGLSSRALKADETGVTGTIVALDGIAIIVNKDSKVEDLTVDQLKQMFGSPTGPRSAATTARSFWWAARLAPAPAMASRASWTSRIPASTLRS